MTSFYNANLPDDLELEFRMTLSDYHRLFLQRVCEFFDIAGYLNIDNIGKSEMPGLLIGGEKFVILCKDATTTILENVVLFLPEVKHSALYVSGDFIARIKNGEILNIEEHQV